MGDIVKAPNFQTDLVCDVSQACESLCSWVRALYQYACIKRHVTPQEAHKKRLNNETAKIHARLQVARLQNAAAQNRLEVVEKQHHLIKIHINELSAQLQKVETQEKEAAVTIKHIRYYTEKWNMAKMVSKSYFISLLIKSSTFPCESAETAKPRKIQTTLPTQHRPRQGEDFTNALSTHFTS